MDNLSIKLHLLSTFVLEMWSNRVAIDTDEVSLVLAHLISERLITNKSTLTQTFSEKLFIYIYI